MGGRDGTAEGELEGSFVGIPLGARDGLVEGPAVGARVGVSVL